MFRKLRYYRIKFDSTAVFCSVTSESQFSIYTTSTKQKERCKMQNTQWQSLFTRYGFQMTSTERGFDLITLNEENSQFLRFFLQQLGVDFYMNYNELFINSIPVTEEIFVSKLEEMTDGRTEMLYHVSNLPFATLDTYIAGMVTQLNRLGCMTAISCDGHDKRTASIGFQTAEGRKKAHVLFEYVQLPYRPHNRQTRLHINRKDLPTFAEKLSGITFEKAAEIFEESNTILSMKEFGLQLETLLSIPGTSGNEGQIRKHVIEEIKPYVDKITTDHYGNILATKTLGDGPTVLLNAHLDTVEEISHTRKILKQENIWRSSEGILGADDRAGINVILATAKSLTEKNFQGTVKYIFTVEEEIGLVGAYEINETFLWDVDMAFVIDRRGNGDIVTSKGGISRFCTERFGQKIEQIARHSGMSYWKTTTGGSSDAAIWASHGIQSVNLSAGYNFEHTDHEQLDVKANYGTYELVLELLENSQRLTESATRVKRLSKNIDSSIAK